MYLNNNIKIILQFLPTFFFFFFINSSSLYMGFLEKTKWLTKISWFDKTLMSSYWTILQSLQPRTFKHRKILIMLYSMVIYKCTKCTLYQDYITIFDKWQNSNIIYILSYLCWGTYFIKIKHYRLGPLKCHLMLYT